MRFSLLERLSTCTTQAQLVSSRDEAQVKRMTSAGRRTASEKAAMDRPRVSLSSCCLVLQPVCAAVFDLG
jgi:hypothetical protein